MAAAPHAGGGGVGYVLAVPESQHVHALGRIDFAIAQAPDDAWERHSCGNGAKGLVPALLHRSPWQKSGDSWQLAVPR